MAKRNKKADSDQQNDPVVAELTQEKPILIVEGKLPDEHCSWKYQINTGPTKGMVHGVNGKPLIVHGDLTEAFQKFRPHLAALCDKANSADAANYEEVSDHEDVALVHVTGFKIKGAGEAESISLIGSFHSMTASGRNDVTTEFVSLEDGSEYRWYNELKETADLVRREIELYAEGKCTPQNEQLSLAGELEEEEEAI